jgi:hypothetical protein
MKIRSHISASQEEATIRIAASRRELVRDIAGRSLAHQSFMVDADADQMAMIGAAALSLGLSIDDRRRCFDFGQGLTGPWMVLRGVPNQLELPATPQAFGDDTEVNFADTMLLGGMALAGLKPIAFSYENYGKVMRNVAPSRLSENAISSHGAKLALQWHTDNAYAFELGFRSPISTGHPGVPAGSPSPKYLCFVGLRNRDANGTPVPTELLPVDKLRGALPSRLLEVLKRPLFEIMPGASNQRDAMKHMPLLETCPQTGANLLRFNANDGQTLGLTLQGRNAVNEVAKRLAELDSETLPIFLEPGELLFFDNYRVLHRRGSFDPGPPETARWLRRCFGTTNPMAGQYVDRVHRPFVWV